MPFPFAVLGMEPTTSHRPNLNHTAVTCSDSEYRVLVANRAHLLDCDFELGPGGDCDLVILLSKIILNGSPYRGLSLPPKPGEKIEAVL